MHREIEAHYEKSMRWIRERRCEIAHGHPENIKFFNAYPLDDETVMEEVLRLTPEEAQGRPTSEHYPDRHGAGSCLEYLTKGRCFENRHGDLQSMDLYIKLKLPPESDTEGRCKILSFHVQEGTRPRTIGED